MLSRTLVLALFLLTGCLEDPTVYQQLYNRPGFDIASPRTRSGAGTYPSYPSIPMSNERGVRVAPDYYYRKQQGYQPSAAPPSKFYGNPYALTPPAQYPYTDADRYYVPPQGSKNYSPEEQGGSMQNSGGLY